MTGTVRTDWSHRITWGPNCFGGGTVTEDNTLVQGKYTLVSLAEPPKNRSLHQLYPANGSDDESVGQGGEWAG